jgi:hypothetical protein
MVDYSIIIRSIFPAIRGGAELGGIVSGVISK